jgi:hypothetical protein
MKSRLPKLPFDAMSGLPSNDDKEVAALMDTLAHMPRDSVDGLAHCLLRAALARERSGEVTHLIRLAEDTLTTVRLQKYLPEEDAAKLNSLRKSRQAQRVTLAKLMCYRKRPLQQTP